MVKNRTRSTGRKERVENSRHRRGLTKKNRRRRSLSNRTERSRDMDAAVARELKRLGLNDASDSNRSDSSSRSDDTD